MIRLSLNRILMVVVLVPTLVLAALAGVLLFRAYGDFQTLQRSASLAEIAIAAGDYATAVLPEASTATAVGSNYSDETARSAYLEAQAAADAQYQALLAGFTTTPVDDEVVQTILADLEARNGELASVRTQLVNGGYMARDIAPFYEPLSGKAIELVSRLSALAKDEAISNAMRASNAALNVHQGLALAAAGNVTLNGEVVPASTLLLWNHAVELQSIFGAQFQNYGAEDLAAAAREFNAVNGANLAKINRHISINGGMRAAPELVETAMSGQANTLWTDITTQTRDRMTNDIAQRSAASFWSMMMTLAASLVVGLGVVLISRASINALRTLLGNLTDTMTRLADQDYSAEVPYTDRQDAVGIMARAVDTFRVNGIKFAEMGEAEAGRNQQVAERARTMQQLQSELASVIGAAVAGDFSRRVTSQFNDHELDGFAHSVNTLVETVDRGVSETGTVLSAMADTDLTSRVTGDYEGAFARLKSDTNAVADKLGEVVGQLRATSRSLRSATGEILAGANDLSERTTKQAATIEETSAAMEQLATTVTENAGKAEDATVRTQSAAQLADEGGQVMSQATDAMERITTSSSKISNIIGMIDDIAFQTNLLALNASVEAARAGEAGKGFAVVAVEVRRLAQSAAQASSEVKALIEQSAQEVSGGSKLVAIAAQKLTAISQAVQENSLLMKDISDASRAQSSAIGEVSAAVRQMDEMTQHNAALVEETNAAIEQTEAQASDLDRIVDIFKIDETPVVSQPANPVKAGIKALQERVSTAARTYLSHGNAAVKEDWSEF